MYLDDTTQSIEVLLGEIIATTECDIVAAFEDLTATTFTIGANDLTTHGTAPVIAVPPPDSAVKRRVKELTIHNADTISHEITVRYASADGDRIVWKGDVLSGATKCWGNGAWASDVLDLAATALPEMDGAAAVGTAKQWAREDHVHPSDDSKADLASPDFTGVPTAPNPTIGDDTTQLATTAWANDEIAAQAVRYDAAQSLSDAQKTQARSNIAAALAGHLVGLTLSTAGSSATFSVAAGSAADSTGVDLMRLASALSKTTSAWAAGSGNGALDTGSISASSWYWTFLIKNPANQAVDVLITKAVAGSVPAPTLPTGFTLFRYIGSLKTNASSQWVSFKQVGDSFLWATQVLDVGGSTAYGVNVTATTISVPLGVNVDAMIAGAVSGTVAMAAMLLSSPLVPQVNGSTSAFHSAFIYTAGQFGFCNVRVLTNTSGQVNISVSAASPAISVYLNTFGWVDRRGRDG
jgi:hypothetical protein